MLPTGEQFEITNGDARAIVTEVGAGLRAFEFGGRAYCETYGADQRPPQGSGAILVPWPNRVRAGRWIWRGQPQQLALTEPAAGNAIHGLARHVCWRPLSSAAGAVGLEVRIPPQPGWPQPLRCTIAYSVGPDGLTVAHTARNLGSAPVPFGVGAHPYLRAGDADTDDCVLTLAATARLPLDDKQLPAGPPEPVAGTADDFRGGRAVRGLKLDAAFGGCVPASGDTLVRHRLIAPAGGVELWAEPAFGWVQVFTPDDHPGRGRAVAVEPMTCPPDALNSGQDLIVLEPDQQWSGSWGIRPL